MSTIEGVWSSRYEYAQGSIDELQVSEHRVTFAQVGGKWIGQSLPSDDGSKVSLVLTQDRAEFSGEWHEHTSPTGHYRGREFKGLILLLLREDGTELNGMWLGAGSSSGQVKAGSWTFKREPGGSEGYHQTINRR